MSFTWSVEYELLPSITSSWSSLHACCWLCSFLTSCRLRSFHPLWVRSSTRCGSALLPASFHQDHPSVHVSGFTLSCVRSPASLFCECVSLAPQARYTPSFAVWCLGLSRACAVLLRSSWHSMSRSPWHSMAFQRRFPTSCSPVHVLTHVFSFARSFTCCACGGR